MHARDVLLTGLPRSGTTLTCELLHGLPDTVALDEPMRGRPLTGRPDPPLAFRVARRLRLTSRRPGGEADVARACANVDGFLVRTRETLLSSGVAVSKNVGGRVLGAKISDDRSGAGLRRRLARRGEIRVDKPLSPDFLLVIKQNSAFTALAGVLASRFPLYAVIRNPLAVLSSWQTVPFPVREGHVPVAEALDADLRDALAATADRVERQLHLLSWYYGHYRDALPDSSVVRYEDIVVSRGRALRAVAASAAGLHVALESRNRARVYEPGAVEALGQRLLDSEGAYWHYYERAAVTELLAAARGSG